ncbi:hypothetical protein P7K49_013932, partial [Saguinus oedipus]
MEQYIYNRKSDGIYILNLKKTCEKFLLAACAIVAIENLADVSVTLSRKTGQRAMLSFAAVTRAALVAGHFTPRTFTNQIPVAFQEPWWLLMPGLTTSPSQRHLMLTYLPLL